MKRLSLILLVSLIALLPGCGLEREAGNGTISAETVYSSDIPPEDCYLCGGGIENLIPSYWGQNNVALISLNTFEIKPIEINRYDITQIQKQSFHIIFAIRSGMKLQFLSRMIILICLTNTRLSISLTDTIPALLIRFAFGRRKAMMWR